MVTVEKVPGIQGKFKPGDRVYVEPVSQTVHNETLTPPPAASEKDFDKTRPDSDVYQDYVVHISDSEKNNIFLKNRFLPRTPIRKKELLTNLRY